MLQNKLAVPLHCIRGRREIFFLLYVELKGTISTFHTLDMSVSYDRDMDVRGGLVLSVSRPFAEDGVVVHSTLSRESSLLAESIPNGKGMPAFAANLRTGVHDEAWFNHLHNVVTEKHKIPVAYSGFFSNGQRAEDVRLRVTIEVPPIFYEKASTVAIQKHSMIMVKKEIEVVNPGQVSIIEGD